MDCSLPGSSIHGIFRARVLECVAISSPGDLPDPRIKPRSPTLQADALPSEPPGKSKDYYYLCVTGGEIQWVWMISDHMIFLK